MKDPSRIDSNNSISSSVPIMTISNDVILTNDVIPTNDAIMRNQFNYDDNPFAEYMWMENEEEFNRQVSHEYYSLLYNVSPPYLD